MGRFLHFSACASVWWLAVMCCVCTFTQPHAWWCSCSMVLLLVVLVLVPLVLSQCTSFLISNMHVNIHICSTMSTDVVAAAAIALHMHRTKLLFRLGPPQTHKPRASLLLERGRGACIFGDWQRLCVGRALNPIPIVPHAPLSLCLGSLVPIALSVVLASGSRSSICLNYFVKCQMLRED